MTSLNMSGIMVWDLSLDDFNGHCHTGSYPMLTAIGKALELEPAKLVKPRGHSEPSAANGLRSTWLTVVVMTTGWLTLWAVSRLMDGRIL